MILVLGGTTEGREISKLLSDNGYSYTLSVVSEYGLKIAENALGGRQRILNGALDIDGFVRLIDENQISAVVDASHPFAAAASKNSFKAAAKTNIPYIRYEREKCLFPKNVLITYADKFNEAAFLSAEYSGVIFLTVGGNHVSAFMNGVMDGHRVVARVLPTPESITNCVNAGIDGSNIIAAQGPFSKDFNKACLREYEASVLVTKNSGDVGGTREKVDAAVDLNVPVIIIEPPLKDGPLFNDYNELINEIERLCS